MLPVWLVLELQLVRLQVNILQNYVAYKNAIGLDMGGTSTDISLMYDGELRVTKDWFIEYGYPIGFPSIEILRLVPAVEV